MICKNLVRIQNKKWASSTGRIRWYTQYVMRCAPNSEITQNHGYTKITKMLEATFTHEDYEISKSD